MKQNSLHAKSLFSWEFFHVFYIEKSVSIKMITAYFILFDWRHFLTLLDSPNSYLAHVFKNCIENQ